MSFCNLYLTCTDTTEASKISRALLKKHFISGARQVQLEKTLYWWKGEIAEEREVLLIMESREDLFTDIELEIAKLHSYETFVLQMIPIKQLNQSAAEWMADNLVD
jgi:periplasmic divalent cation tolerance protein